MMAYSNRFVMCVLVNGNVQKELANGTVPIPFGEYTLRFRNKHPDRRAVVKFTIDGEDAGGNGYIVNANSYVDIKRHVHRDAAFKLVPLDSAEAVDAGKNGPNTDKLIGVIEAKFYLEKVQPVYTYTPPAVVEKHIHHHHHHRRIIREEPWIKPYSPFWYGTTTAGGASMSMSNPTHSASSEGLDQTLSFNAAPTMDSLVMADSGDLKSASFTPPATKLSDGATVEGGRTGQNFREVEIELETDYVAVKLFLQGFHPQPVTHYMNEEPRVTMPGFPSPVRPTPMPRIVPQETPAQENARLKEELEKLQYQKVVDAENERIRKENEELRKKLAELKGETV